MLTILRVVVKVMLTAIFQHWFINMSYFCEVQLPELFNMLCSILHDSKGEKIGERNFLPIFVSYYFLDDKYVKSFSRKEDGR